MTNVSSEQCSAVVPFTPQLQPHPIANLFPQMDPQAFAWLKADIKEHGMLEPITVHEGKILDGRHRLRACSELGRDGLDIKPEFRDWNGQGGDPISFVVSRNLIRRHLNESQRAMLGARFIPLFQSEARERMLAGKSDPSATLR